MKANIEKTFELTQPIERVWAFLSNPEKVVTCVPGANLTEKLDEENYKGVVAVKFGPVSAKYNGQINIEELDHSQYEMKIAGKGKDSKGKGNAGMVMVGRLKALNAQNTQVSYDMELNVTGKLAQFGARLIADVSDHLTEQFIDNFKTTLKAEYPTDTADTGTAASAERDNSVNAFALMWAVIKGFFARLFGGGKKSEAEA